MDDKTQHRNPGTPGYPTMLPPPDPQPASAFNPSYQPHLSGPSVSYPIGGDRQASMPSPYWPVTVISMLFCLVPGLIGMYFSAQVRARWAQGDVTGSTSASRAALIWGIVGIVVGVIVFIALLSSGGDSYSYSY